MRVDWSQSKVPPDRSTLGPVGVLVTLGVQFNGTRGTVSFGHEIIRDLICLTLYGRTSSWMLRKVLMKINAVCLAGSLSPLLGYCRSHFNPAEAPSRTANPLSPEMGTQCHADDGDLSEAAADGSDLHTGTTPASVPQACPEQ